jgi:hypothetical protein
LLPPGVSTVPEVTAFSVAQAFVHVERVALEPHPIGTAENGRVRGYIVAQLRALGLEPELQTVGAPDYFGGSGRTERVVNVIARIPGTASTGAVLLAGHYDTVPTTAGANDDGSAVGVMLETARALRAGTRLRNDVILLFTDGEEPAPRFGSSAFVTDHPWAADIGFAINLEALGSSGPSTLIETSGPDAWVLRQYTDALRNPIAYSYLTTTTALIGGSNSDFEPFRNLGIPGVELAYLHGSPIYHTLADAPDRVSRRSLHHHGANALALTRHLGGLDLRESHAHGETVFFTVGRFAVVRYSASWAVPISVLVCVPFVIAAWRRREPGVAASGALLPGIVLPLTTVLLSALAATAVWTVLATSRASMSITESYLYLVSFSTMTVGIGIAVSRLVRCRVRGRVDATGVVGVWLVLTLVTSATAPGFSYLFAWPTLAGSVALLWTSRATARAHPGKDLAGFALVTGTALILLIPPIDTFYQLAQPRPGNPDSEILALIAVPIALIALVVELIRAFRVRDPRSGQ